MIRKMNMSTLDKPPIPTISKNLENWPETIKIGIISKRIACGSILKAYSLVYWVLTISLFLCSLVGIIFGVCNWISIFSNSDASEEIKLSLDVDQGIRKQEKTLA